MHDIRAEADLMLADIALLTERLGLVQTAADVALAEVTRFYAGQIGDLKQRLKAAEKELIGLARKNKKELFAGRDKLELAHGIMLHTVESRVKRARGMLANLEKLGFDEAIKIAKSVDWDALEKWDDEKLAQAGTCRQAKENFSYELKKGPGR